MTPTQTPRWPAQVEVRPARDPAGRPAVLLQLPDGYVTLLPADTRRVARMLTDAAEEVEDGR